MKLLLGLPSLGTPGSLVSVDSRSNRGPVKGQERANPRLLGRVGGVEAGVGEFGGVDG